MAHQPSGRQAQTPPPQIAHQQQEDQHQAAGSNSSGSPRRRKPPLDIDAALFLQSQAQYVQEPTNFLPQLPPQSQRGWPQSGSRVAAASGNVGGAPAQTAAVGSPSKPPLAAGGSAAQHQVVASNSQQQQSCALKNSGAHISRFNFDYNYYDPNNRYGSNNISVDYIDCVTASGDCSDQVGRPPHVAMRGHLSSCRKHLRFQRTNRVEPKLGETDNRAQAAGAPSSSSSSSLVEQPPPPPPQTPASSQLAYQSEPQISSPPPSGALFPIPVSEVKKRTYFIGSVGQDSLIGHDELSKYFPQSRVNIFVCTWNQNRKRAPLNLNDLLLPDQLVLMPDIYAIGIQEAFSSQTDYLREWEIELQTTLGPNHVLLHSCSLGTLHLSLFVRRDLIWFCSMPEESVYNSRSMPTNMIKTKGAVSIAFRFFGTSFMFTNCHFPAHENKLKDRVDEYQRIINSINLPKNLKLLKPRYLSNDSTARFDCVFFMGDLNFRLESRTFDETINILEDIFQQREPSYENLTQNDELLRVMESNQAFHGFDESQIRFPPTYKFLAQTNKYDRQTKRVPSYTDRILFRSKRQRHIQCLIYDWLPQLLSSDHKPVYCLFDVLIRPGHEKNMVSSLNAGLFQRAIYLEALKRRSEDPDGLRENGAGGNLICSIS